MRAPTSAAVAQLFRQQYGVAARSQLRGVGVTAAAERWKVALGEWDRPSRQVVRLVGAPLVPEQALMAALLEAGPSAVASHQSAVWLWGLGPPPPRDAVTVGSRAAYRRGEFDLHRLRGVSPAVVLVRRIPVTNPLRSLVDLAGVADPEDLDAALDAAIARRLVTVAGVKAELGRLSRKGRKGVGAMRAALARRGLTEGPHPSVLEAHLHRLLRSGGLTPMATEVVAGSDGSYRIDTFLDPHVAVEVDGHAFHSTPEQKAYDERRRADIRMTGVFLLVYDWRAVRHDGRRVLAECHRALSLYGSAAAESRRPGPDAAGGLAD